MTGPSKYHQWSFTTAKSTINTLLLIALLLVSSSSVCDARSFSSRSLTSPVHTTTRKAFLPPKQKDIKKNIETVSELQRGGDDGKSSMSTAIFNLVKGIVGVGVLSLPAGVAAFGDAKGAVLPAVALITTVGILSGYNFSLIGRVCSYTGATSYRNAWEKSVGLSTAWIPAVACTCKTFLAVLAYSMVLAETFQGIFQSFGIGSITRTQTLIGLTLTTLLPLCLMKNLASLAPFSLMGIMGMALTVGVMALRFFDGSYALPDGKFLVDVAENLQPVFGTKGASSVFSPNAFILICMLSTAYMAHFNAPKFFIELENNTIKRYNTLVSTSFAASITIFCSATALGFATFGKACAGFVLSNYSSKDSLIGLSRIAVAFSLIFTYPLVFVGCRDGALDVLQVPAEKRTNDTLDKLTLVLLTFITTAAILLKDLSFVLAFGGATLGNALIYILPAIMYRSVVKNLGDSASDSMKNEVYFSNFTGLLGVVMGCIGANMALKN